MVKAVFNAFHLSKAGLLKAVFNTFHFVSFEINRSLSPVCFFVPWVLFCLFPEFFFVLFLLCWWFEVT